MSMQLNIDFSGEHSEAYYRLESMGAPEFLLKKVFSETKKQLVRYMFKRKNPDKLNNYHVINLCGSLLGTVEGDNWLSLKVYLPKLTLKEQAAVNIEKALPTTIKYEVSEKVIDGYKDHCVYNKGWYALLKGVCEAGISINDLLDDEGLTPCYASHECERQCDKQRFPNSDEVKQFKKDITNRHLKIKPLIAQLKNTGKRGCIECCPCCGKKLFWGVFQDGSFNMSCQTANCVDIKETQ